MIITTVMGSPRRHGNTAAVLGMFEKLVVPRHQVEHVSVVDYSIHGCLGCLRCQRVLDEPGCVQKDDALSIFERILGSDAIVYATPLYGWSFSAQLKALVDRHYCLTKNRGRGVWTSLLEGKRAALLVTCKGDVEGNADLIQVQFDRCMKMLGCTTIGKYVVPRCTEPDELGTRAAEVAEAMARDLTSGR